MAEYINYVHNDPEFEVVADLLSGEPILSRFTAAELLDYKGTTNITNRERIVQSLNQVQVDNGDFDDISDEDLPLTLGIQILIPKSKLETNSESLLVTLPFSDQGNDSRKFTNFISDTYRQLLENPNYKTVYSNQKAGKYVNFYPQITVFLWSRMLNRVINISPFIQQCDVDSGDNGASFSISLPPIIGIYENGNWEIDKDNIDDFLNKDYYATSSLFRSNELKENNFYFHNIITPNDLVFIQFETLEVEKSLRIRDSRSYNVEYSKLPNRIYDLIGSVDSNTLNYSAGDANINIQIEGRDLTKFLIDDGSYFFIEELLGELIPDRPENKKLRGRIYGRVPELNVIGYRSIQDQLSIILNLYYTVGYYPNEIFANFDRNEGIVTDSTGVEQYKEGSVGRRDFAIEQIKESRSFYKLTFEKGEDAKAEQVFSILQQLISTDSLIDVDESGSFLSLQAQLELDGELYDSDLTTNTSVEGNAFGPSIQGALTYSQFNDQVGDFFINQEIRGGIWQIFDIETDPSIANIRVYDNKLNEANGSILSSIKSMVEEPFMEVFTDTYGDRFKLIARRQPFNEQYYNELVDDTIIDTPERKIGVIEPEDVISENLAFNDEEIYTWYYLKPTGLSLSDMPFLSYPKAVVLPEYVDIWGSRPYNKETNYAPFVTKRDIDAKVNTNLKQAILDLQYMIQINSYLPFARKGQIVINGDRTYKKKTAVYLRQTDEICHIDSVQNSYIKNGDSVERVTVLSVNRVLKRKFMKPKDVDGIEGVSYFNIVNTDFSESDLRNGSTGDSDFATRITRNWTVNKDIFNFFYQKRQFNDNVSLGGGINFNDANNIIPDIL